MSYLVVFRYVLSQFSTFCMVSGDLHFSHNRNVWKILQILYVFFFLYNFNTIFSSLRAHATCWLLALIYFSYLMYSFFFLSFECFLYSFPPKTANPPHPTRSTRFIKYTDIYIYSCIFHPLRSPSKATHSSARPHAACETRYKLLFLYAVFCGLHNIFARGWQQKRLYQSRITQKLTNKIRGTR